MAMTKKEKLTKVLWAVLKIVFVAAVFVLGIILGSNCHGGDTSGQQGESFTMVQTTPYPKGKVLGTGPQTVTGKGSYLTTATGTVPQSAETSCEVECMPDGVTVIETTMVRQQILLTHGDPPAKAPKGMTVLKFEGSPSDILLRPPSAPAKSEKPRDRKPAASAPPKAPVASAPPAPPPPPSPTPAARTAGFEEWMEKCKGTELLTCCTWGALQSTAQKCGATPLQAGTVFTVADLERYCTDIDSVQPIFKKKQGICMKEGS